LSKRKHVIYSPYNIRIARLILASLLFFNLQVLSKSDVNSNESSRKKILLIGYSHGRLEADLDPLESRTNKFLSSIHHIMDTKIANKRFPESIQQYRVSIVKLHTKYLANITKHREIIQKILANQNKYKLIAVEESPFRLKTLYQRMKKYELKYKKIFNFVNLPHANKIFDDLHLIFFGPALYLYANGKLDKNKIIGIDNMSYSDNASQAMYFLHQELSKLPTNEKFKLDIITILDKQFLTRQFLSEKEIEKYIKKNLKVNKSDFKLVRRILFKYLKKESRFMLDVFYNREDQMAYRLMIEKRNFIALVGLYHMAPIAKHLVRNNLRVEQFNYSLSE